MSPRPVPLATTVLLTAASSSLFLAGCGEGGGGIYTTPAPATSAPATPLPDSDDPTASPTATPRPQSKCCWSNWGNHYDCGNYPEGGSGGICNNDGSTTCGGNADCAEIVPLSTTPPPTTTPYRRPTTTTTTLPEGACLMTQSRGCFNGQSFAFSEHFVCGKGANIGTHKWGQSSCCALGITYDPHDEFCCNSALNDFTEGQCHEFDPNDDPPECRCSSSEVAEVTEVAVGAEDTVIIDTQDWRTPAERPCLKAEGTMGCLNGFLFDPSSDTLCGQYIVKGDTHGCCPTHDGIKVYNLQTESCCQFGNTGDVRPGAHRCQCRQWRNGDCLGSLFSTVI